MVAITTGDGGGLGGGGGGGGGSFVYELSGSGGTLLAAAGGGGGAGYTHNGGSGVAGPSGGAGGGASHGAGGVAGAAGAGSPTAGAGGGGYTGGNASINAGYNGEVHNLASAGFGGGAGHLHGGGGGGGGGGGAGVGGGGGGGFGGGGGGGAGYGGGGGGSYLSSGLLQPTETSGEHSGNGLVTTSLAASVTDTITNVSIGVATPWSTTNAVGGTPWSLGTAPTAAQANDHVVALGASILDTTNIQSDPNITLNSNPTEVIGGLTLGVAEVTPTTFIAPSIVLEQNLDVTGASGTTSFGAQGSDIIVGDATHSAELYVGGPATSAAGVVFVYNGAYVYAGQGNTEMVAVNAGAAYSDSGGNNAGTVQLDGGTFNDNGVGDTTVVDMTNGGTFNDNSPSFNGSIGNFGVGGAISILPTCVYEGVTAGPGGDNLNLFNLNTLTQDYIPISLAAGVTPDEVGQEANGLIEVVVCFVSGTRLRTARGEVAVEDLAIGDLAVTATGEARPIVWIGRRRIVNPTAGQQPVRVSAGAFGVGLPARDLWLSHGHAVCIEAMDEVFVPISHLINGSTIVREAASDVTYWHVELESHDVLLAEGLPCESYMDAGNRAWFGRAYGRLEAIDPERVAESLSRYARPFVDGGPIVAAIRERLAARAERALDKDFAVAPSCRA
ncbi:MAG: Hint domain-containing protein [Caulobacteraceae bacterium]